MEGLGEGGGHLAVHINTDHIDNLLWYPVQEIVRTVVMRIVPAYLLTKTTKLYRILLVSTSVSDTGLNRFLIQSHSAD